MKHDVSITIDGKNVALPVLEASAGLDVVDVRGLINEGLFTFDPGFLSTASCESKITYIDGDAGVLTYRGYPIEALANGAEHLEVCYLLLHGELPTQSALDQFKGEIKARMPIDGQFAKIFEGFTASSHPMSMLCAGVGGLAALFHEGLDIYNADHRMESAMQLIAKVPTLAAMSYRKSIGKSFVDVAI